MTSSSLVVALPASSAATALAEQGVASSSSKHGRRSEVERTAFIDPGDGRACRQWSARPCRRLSRDVHVSSPLEHDRSTCTCSPPAHRRDRSRRPRVDASNVRRCRRHSICSAAWLRWKGIGWGDRAALVHMRHVDEGPAGETVREWLVRHRQTPRSHRAAVGTAGCRRAESVDRRGVGGARSRVCCDDVHATTGATARLALPLKALDELYAIPSREYIETCGGSCASQCARARDV